MEIRGEKPVVAFAMMAFVISFSTAVGNVAKDEYDSEGDKTISGFFLYLAIVFVTAFLVHSMLMFVFSYGGRDVSECNASSGAECAILSDG